MKSASVVDVANFPLVVLRLATRDALDGCSRTPAQARYAMELDSSELLKRFVAADVGVGSSRAPT